MPPWFYPPRCAKGLRPSRGGLRPIPAPAEAPSEPRPPLALIRRCVARAPAAHPQPDAADGGLGVAFGAPCACVLHAPGRLADMSGTSYVRCTLNPQECTLNVR